MWNRRFRSNDYLASFGILGANSSTSPTSFQKNTPRQPIEWVLNFWGIFLTMAPFCAELITWINFKCNPWTCLHVINKFHRTILRLKFKIKKINHMLYNWFKILKYIHFIHTYWNLLNHLHTIGGVFLVGQK